MLQLNSMINGDWNVDKEVIGVDTRQPDRDMNY